MCIRDRYTAAEKIYMKGRMEEAKTSLNKYLQTFPEGAFSLNAHYYLCLIGSEPVSYTHLDVYKRQVWYPQ